MEYLYLSLEEEFLNKNKEQMKGEAKAELGNDGEGKLLYVPDPIAVRIEEIDDTTISLVSEGKHGYICMSATLGTDEMIKLLEIATKKLNKLKTVIEAVK